MSTSLLLARSMPLPELLATVPPGHRDEPWTWADEERDIAIRLCLCCGKPGHHQETVEALIAAGRLPARACIGEDGRLHDGHHRVVAAIRLGLESVDIEPKSEADARWQSDHSGTMWELRQFGDVHPGEAWAYVQKVRQQARDFVAREAEKGKPECLCSRCGADAITTDEDGRWACGRCISND